MKTYEEIIDMEIEDDFGQIFSSIEELKEKIEEEEKGCKEKINDDDDDDDDDAERCSYGNLCESCAEAIEGHQALLAKYKDQSNDEMSDLLMASSDAFVDKSSKLGYDREEVEDLIFENYTHGAYMQDHGSCSETIMMAYDGETLHLTDDEIEHLIDCMGGASSRHNDTNYDAMRADGIQAELARQII